ncbi:MAG TPA: HEAT repeat domain-containing protein [Phycisphaerae bacterium]|nr:HEAT repeat domain-containing protein [Phycisphaerae bacterium]HOM50772.1 HEAT repeat domain-containing protein [Phycisphaerae bacterium]HON65148.1 HEAT repeat domain-containing protein [Phycisphaerae bacterium]HOQ85827.1 HEAT repeat domain-containing protein [Phycisphaerae bacterium]HPP26053.1 HEAT repeat domain-containing protein [Phycisphaerae bacterium]
MSTRCIQRSEKELSAISYQLSARSGQPSRAPFSASPCRRVTASSFSFLLILAVGCSEADKRKWQHRTPEENFSTALESTNGDLRREAVVRIAESSYWASDDAFHVLDAVARTDPLSQVRCIAIRTLARYNDARPVGPLLAILTANPAASQPAEARALPGDDDVRWEAARALHEMQRKRLLSPEQESAACELYIQLQRSDPSRNVRIVSTKALGEFRDRRVFAPLIRSLRNPDFMIADSAERSLIALTGQSHQYDANAWNKWLEETPDPFAHAGEAPTSQPAGADWWDQQDRAWRKFLKLGTD